MESSIYPQFFQVPKMDVEIKLAIVIKPHTKVPTTVQKRMKSKQLKMFRRDRSKTFFKKIQTRNCTRLTRQYSTVYCLGAGDYKTKLLRSRVVQYKILFRSRAVQYTILFWSWSIRYIVLLRSRKVHYTLLFRSRAVQYTILLRSRAVQYTILFRSRAVQYTTWSWFYGLNLLLV